eukprot:g2211.t1
MYRTGGVGGRARWTSHGFLAKKTNKTSLGGTSDRSKRGGISRAVKTSVNVCRRGATTLDVLAFTSAIRGAATNALLYHKTGVMRYDPLKKNVARPFRALFSFVLGFVKNVLHSVLTLAVTSTGKLTTPNRRRESRRQAAKMNPTQTEAVKSVSPELVSHPVNFMRRSSSELQLSSFNSRPLSSRCPSVRSTNDDEINAVLKTYNTTESRDRLISKLKSMKSGSTDCVRSLSQRNHAADHHTTEPLTRKQLIACKQEIINLSKQFSTPREQLHSKLRSRRCLSSASGSVAPDDVESLLRMKTHVAEKAKSSTSEKAQSFISEKTKSSVSQLDAPKARTFAVEGATLKQTVDIMMSTSMRSETLRMKLKKHESMVDSLKSRTAVKKILNGKTHRRSSSDVGLELK